MYSPWLAPAPKREKGDKKKKPRERTNIKRKLIERERGKQGRENKTKKKTARRELKGQKETAERKLKEKKKKKAKTES